MAQPISPLHLAENIELDVLREVYGGRRRRAYSELLRTAHYLLESALATDGADSENYFEAASSNLATMIGRDFSLQDRSVAPRRQFFRRSFRRLMSEETHCVTRCRVARWAMRMLAWCACWLAARRVVLCQKYHCLIRGGMS